MQIVLIILYEVRYKKEHKEMVSYNIRSYVTMMKVIASKTAKQNRLPAGRWKWKEELFCPMYTQISHYSD